MTLPMDFGAVLAALQHPAPLQVVDTVGGYTSGVWTEEETGQRAIAAIVLAMKTADLEFYREACATDSGISVTTGETLHFTDVTATGTDHRQSYVLYQGYLFRVAGTGFMMGNTRLNMYHCVRYLP